MGAASCDWVAAPFRFRFRGREDDDMQYSEGFKARMIQKMLDPAPMSGCALSRETGVPQGTLSRWLRRARRVGGMNETSESPASDGKPPRRRPQDWSAAEKLDAVLQASSLSNEDLGAFLRSKGLHDADLHAWRKTVLTALGGRQRKSRRPSKETKKIRQLESELNRKEKALAEAAALLILKKKVQSIWGDEEGSTSGRKGS
jgi:transposase